MRGLVIDAIAPEGIQCLVGRGFDVDQVASTLAKDVVLLLDEDVAPEVMEEVAKALEADFARLIRIAP